MDRKGLPASNVAKEDLESLSISLAETQSLLNNSHAENFVFTSKQVSQSILYFVRFIYPINLILYNKY